jgi:hypothetical protein
MLKRGLIALALTGLAMPTHAEEPRRQLGPHEHGVGHLAIAIEGKNIEMELETPANDILGFEHAPSTDLQKKTLSEAKTRLGKIAGLFVLTPEAGCKPQSADVDVLGAAAGQGEAHDHDHDHDKKADTGEAEDHHHAHGTHSEFRVTYKLECASPAKLGTVAFDYFKAFKGARKLGVTVIGPKGQSSYVVTREKPVLDLSGVS